MGENEDSTVSKKQPSKTISKGTNLRAAALQAFTKAQDPWGSKNPKATKCISVLSPTETRWYALDYALRKLMEYIQDSDPSLSAYISQPATIQLRKLVMDTLSDATLEGLTSEYTYEFPDPEIVAQNEARKRQESQASEEDRKARQKLMAEQKAARQARLQQKQKEASNENENPAPEASKDKDKLTTDAEDDKKSRDKSSRSPRRSSRRSPRKSSKSREKREKISKRKSKTLPEEASSSEKSADDSPGTGEEASSEQSTPDHAESSSPKAQEKKKQIGRAHV